jgi:sec-independent protein translocase protein TatC
MVVQAMIKNQAQHQPKRRARSKRHDTKHQDISKPLIEHLNELRSRLVWVVLTLAASGIAAFVIHDKLLAIVQKPLGETLYYTSPAGGLNFLIKLCFTFAVIASLPVIMYHILKFLNPLLERTHKRAVVRYIFASIILAYGGVVFAYLVSLPAALHFLSNFGGEDIASLITADEYYNFALAYLLGFAVLFQLPVVALFINRIKPLKPGGMMKFQRWLILASFVVAAILTPTPDPINQLIMAAPAVVLYQVSLILVWLINLRRKVPAIIAESVPEVMPVQREFAPLSQMITKLAMKKEPKIVPLQQKPLTQQIISDFSFKPQQTVKDITKRSQTRLVERRPITPNRPPIQRIQGQMRAMDIFAA